MFALFDMAGVHLKKLFAVQFEAASTMLILPVTTLLGKEGKWTWVGRSLPCPDMGPSLTMLISFTQEIYISILFTIGIVVAPIDHR